MKEKKDSFVTKKKNIKWLGVILFLGVMVGVVSQGNSLTINKNKLAPVKAISLEDQIESYQEVSYRVCPDSITHIVFDGVDYRYQYQRPSLANKLEHGFVISSDGAKTVEGKLTEGIRYDAGDHGYSIRKPASREMELDACEGMLMIDISFLQF